METKTGHLLLFVIGGIAIGAILWGIAWLAAAGGHGTGLLFTVFFPLSDYLYRIDAFGGRTWLLHVVSFIQMPLYALVASVIWNRRHSASCLLGLLCLHLLLLAISLLSGAARI
jgi:hypothetical protein